MGGLDETTARPDEKPPTNNSDSLVSETHHSWGESHDIRTTGTTHRGLKNRHASMIALGGCIGTGLFVGSSQGLAMGGPLMLLLSYVTLTILSFGIVTQTIEMSSYLPVRGGSMAYLANRIVSRDLGFALGWMYWYYFSITTAAESSAAIVLIGDWGSSVSPAVWVTIFLVVIFALNAFAVGLYGESEFWFVSIKVLGLLAMFIMALVLMCGGGPSHDALWFRYWHDPGPVNEYLETGVSGRVCAFISTITYSIFAFGGAPELMIVVAGEMHDPRKDLPRTSKTFFWRVMFFYVVGVFFIGCTVPSNDPGLLNGSTGHGQSPFALAAQNAGIKVMPTLIDAIIITSAWSCANSSVYLATRNLYSLAVVGNAPRIFTYCTKSGVPMYALIATSSIGLLSYLNISSDGGVVFNWCVNLLNMGNYQSWISVCIVYLRFRKATAVQNITDLPYRSIIQPYAAYICIVCFSVMMLLSGFKVFLSGYWNVSDFLTAYIGIPLFLMLWLGHKLVRGRGKPWAYPAGEVNLTAGLAEIMNERSEIEG